MQKSKCIKRFFKTVGVADLGVKVGVATWVNKLALRLGFQNLYN